MSLNNTNQTKPNQTYKIGCLRGFQVSCGLRISTKNNLLVGMISRCSCVLVAFFMKPQTRSAFLSSTPQQTSSACSQELSCGGKARFSQYRAATVTSENCLFYKKGPEYECYGNEMCHPPSPEDFMETFKII